MAPSRVFADGAWAFWRRPRRRSGNGAPSLRAAFVKRLVPSRSSGARSSVTGKLDFLLNNAGGQYFVPAEASR